MKLIITKVLNRKELVKVIRTNLFNNSCSIKKVFNIVDNLPYEDIWDKDHREQLSYLLNGIAEFKFILSEYEIAERIYYQEDAKYQAAQQWYDSLPIEDKEKIDILTNIRQVVYSSI